MTDWWFTWTSVDSCILVSLISSKDELIDNGEEKTFDMAYIDADKWNYHVYYDKCIQLVRKGGVILMDDVRITQ